MVSVSADIIVKLIRLVDEGNRMAEPFRQDITAAQAQGLKSHGVKAMQ